MFSTPETSVHVLDKNRESSPLEREEGYGGKDLEKRWVLRREWKTLWDTPTTDLGAESEPGDGGEHSEVVDFRGLLFGDPCILTCARKLAAKPA